MNTFIEKNLKAILGLAFVITFIAVVILFIPKKQAESIVDNSLVKQLEKQYKKDIKELRENIELYKELVDDKLYRDSILFVAKTKEINDLKTQIKNIKIENEKKHIINSNTTTSEASIILRDNIKVRTSKKK